MSKSKIALGIALCLIVFGVSLRLLPHPANFAPVAAIAIFGGAILPRRLALWVPLVAMMISDLIIGFYDMMPVVWGCYLLIALASSHWLRKPNLLKGAAMVLASSLFFFVVTNLAVWVSSDMYAHTLSGIAQCYTMALPFFRATLLSDVAYTAILFGTYALGIAVTKRQLAFREQELS